jgi:hypothetical protein
MRTEQQPSCAGVWWGGFASTSSNDGIGSLVPPPTLSTTPAPALVAEPYSYISPTRRLRIVPWNLSDPEFASSIVRADEPVVLRGTPADG